MFTHAEREDLIWSIIEGQNEEADDVDDDGKTPFPSQCGADIDFNELVSTSMCERYFSLHHPRALRKLRRKWGKSLIIAAASKPPNSHSLAAGNYM